MTFAHPTWFWALALLPFFIAATLWRAKRQTQRWHQLRASRLAPFLTQHAATWPRWLSLVCLTIAFIATIFALARPRTETGTKPEITRGRNLLFALDLSRSMRSPDLKPDRLTQAKTTIYDILDLQPSDRAGLIGFSDSAYLFAPLTNDHGALRETISQIDENWLPSHGTNLTAAIKLAINTLQKTKSDNNALILLSDGEEHSGDLSAALEEARKNGVHIFTIAVATDQGETIPDPQSPDGLFHDAQGKLVVTKLDTKILEKIAKDSDGAFWRISPHVAPAVKNAMLKFDAFELKGKDQKTYDEYFANFLIPAAIFFVLALLLQTQWQRFAKKSITTALSVGFLAAISPDARAASLWNQALEMKFLPSTRAYQSLETGFSAYQKQDFPAAQQAYSQALLEANAEQRPHAQLGCADTCFQIGWQQIQPQKSPFTQIVPDPEFQQWLGEKMKKSGSDTKKLQELLKPIRDSWNSALGHYDDLLASQTTNQNVRENRDAVAHYLKLLDQAQQQQEQKNQQEKQNKDQKKDQQKQPQKDQKDQPKQDDPNQQGEPKPDPKGENDPKGGDQPKDDGSGDSDSKKNDQEKSNEPNEEPKDSPDQKPSPSGSPDEQDPKSQQQANSQGESNKEAPKETPKDRAQRLLEQNADLQQNPLVPRLPRPRNGKDW